MSDVLCAVVAVMVVFVYLRHCNGDEADTYHKMGRVIGIDMGSAYIRAGLYLDSSINILSYDNARAIIPAVVSFGDDVTYIGDEAMTKMASNPNNTIHSIYKLLGKAWNDKTVQDMVHDKTMGFRIVPEKDRPYILVTDYGVEKRYLPEEICAILLGHVIQLTEQQLGEKIVSAVLTVPAYITDHQRRAIRNAGKLAGLIIARLINSPTATAVSISKELEKERQNYEDTRYAYEQDEQDDTNIVVVDFGASHLDVSVVNIAEGITETIATQGSPKISGDAINAKLVNHFIEVFIKKTGIDITAGIKTVDRLKAMYKLRQEVERIKRSLSTQKLVQLDIEAFYGFTGFQEYLSRAAFEDMNMKLFRSALWYLSNVLESSGMLPSMIDRLVITGGSSRIPMFQQIMKQFFRHNIKLYIVDNDLSAVNGAVLQAGILSHAEGVKDMLTIDVNTHSLGVDSVNNSVKIIVPRFTPLPITKITEFTTGTDNQNHLYDYKYNLYTSIYEGESKDTATAVRWGHVVMYGLAPYLQGFPLLYTVQFRIDEHGLFIFESKEDRVVMKEFVVTPTVEVLTVTKIKQLSNKVKDIVLHISMHLKRKKYEEEIEMLIFCLQQTLLENKSLSDEEKYKIRERFDAIHDWYTSGDEFKLSYELTDKLREIKYLGSIFQNYCYDKWDLFIH